MIENLRTFLAQRATDAKERGASAVEYGLLIAGIAALIVVAVFALGPVVKDAFSDTCTTIAASDNNTANNGTDCDAG